VPASKPRKTTAAKKDDHQLALPELAPPAPTPEPTTQPTAAPNKSSIPPSVQALAELPTIKLLERARRDRLLRSVAFLIERNGVAKLEAFAAHLSIPAFRIRGFVANELSPVLNIDGYQTLYCDEHHVRLEREMLAQQFEVSL
jgi:hypothetical protein